MRIWLLSAIAAILLIMAASVTLVAGQEDRPSNPFPLSIQWLDVNLDGTNEFLVNLWNRSQSLTQSILFYHQGDTWGRRQVFPLPRSAPVQVSLFRPTAVHVYPQADTLGRTYLIVDLAPTTEAYVPGLMIMRWDHWQPQVVLFEPVYCSGGEWQVRDDGALIIPFASPVPDQGCAVPGYGVTTQHIIADAHLPPSG